MIMNRDIHARLDRITARIYPGGEVEDMRAVDISVYGESAIDEIYQSEGPESLIELLSMPDLLEDEKEMIAGFLRRKGHKIKY